jgi:hypothetical protein
MASSVLISSSNASQRFASKTGVAVSVCSRGVLPKERRREQPVTQSLVLSFKSLWRTSCGALINRARN